MKWFSTWLLASVALAQSTPSNNMLPPDPMDPAYQQQYQDPENPYNNDWQSPYGGPRNRGGPRLREPSAFFNCPFNEGETHALRENTRLALTDLAQEQRRCSPGAGNDAGQGGVAGNTTAASGALNLALETLTRPAPPACETPAAVVEQRVRRLRAHLTQVGTLPAPADYAQAIQSSGLTQGWVEFSYHNLLPAEFSAYVNSGCVIDQGIVRNGLRRALVNMTCVETAADVEVFQAGNSPLQSAAGCQQGDIDPEVMRAVRASLDGIVNLPANCQPGPSTLSNLFRMVASIPMGSVVGDVIMQAANFLTQSFLARGTQTGEHALTMDQANLVRRSAQCMYVQLHRATFGCDRMAQAGPTLAGLISERDAIGRQFPNLQRDYDACLTQHSSMGSERARTLINDLSLPALETALNGGRENGEEVAGACTPEAPPHTRGRAVSALLASCASYRTRQNALRSMLATDPNLAVLDAVCAPAAISSPAAVDLPALCNHFSSGLHSFLVQAADQLPQVTNQISPDRQLSLNQCANELGTVSVEGSSVPAYARVQELNRLIGDAEAAQALQATTVTATGTSVPEMWENFHRAFTQDTATQANIRQSIPLIMSTGRAVTLQGQCAASPRNPQQLSNVINELHATCLLNAGVYLHGAEEESRSRRPAASRDATLINTDTASARSWEQACGPLLRLQANPPVVPLVNGAPAGLGTLDNGNITGWQCQAYDHYDEYRRNLQEVDQRQLFEALCPASSGHQGARAQEG